MNLLTSRSGEGGWWEGHKDVDEFEGEGDDVVYPGTVGFVFEERGWVSGEKERDEGGRDKSR
jgi:hypothetical protein